MFYFRARKCSSKTSISLFGWAESPTITLQFFRLAVCLGHKLGNGDGL